MPDSVKKKITFSGLKKAFKLYRFIKPFQKEYALGMFFLLGTSMASLAFPKLLGELVNSGSGMGEHINRIGLMLAVLLIVQAVFSYFRVVFFVNVTEKSFA